MDELKPNSFKYRSEQARETAPAEERRHEPVVKGTVKTRKKGFGQKFGEVFFSDDAKSIGDYILRDMLIPVAKSTISDIICNTVEMALFGSTSGRRSQPSRNRRGETRTSYESYYNNRDNSYRRDESRYSRMARNDMDNIILETRWEAVEVKDKLLEICERYRVVSVLDLKDILGMAGSSTDRNYGWRDLYPEDIRISHTRDGYLLSLPRAEVLD